MHRRVKRMTLSTICHQTPTATREMDEKDLLEKTPLLSDVNVDQTENLQSQKLASRRAPVIWIALIFYACGISMGMASMRQYIYKVVGDHENSTHLVSKVAQNLSGKEDRCDVNKTSSTDTNKEAADWLLYFELTEYSIVFPVVALCGIYSDFWGRTPFIYMASIGGILQYTVFVIVIYFGLPLHYLFVGYALAGITGSEHVLFMSCSASIADTTDGNKSRSFYIAFIYLCLGIGLTASQLGVGYLIGYFGFVIPNIISVSIMVVALILFCNVPETYRDRHAQKHFCQSLSRLIGFYHDKSYLKQTSKFKFILCLMSFILCIAPTMSRTSLETLYQLGWPFCFTSEKIGYYSSLKELVQLTIGTLLLRLMHFCCSDDVIIVLGSLSAITYYTIEAFARDPWMLYLGALCGILSMMPSPIIKSFLSRMVHEDKQGAVFANIYLIETAAELFSNSLFLSIYANTQTFMKGFVFLVFSGFNLAFVLTLSPVLVSNRRMRVKKVEINVNSS